MTEASIPLEAWLQQGPYKLALSSSFFGFYAHAGVWQALEERNLLPNGISGASAGALTGAAIASGLTVAEIKSLLFSVSKKDFWDPGFGFGLLKGEKFLKILEKNFSSELAKGKYPLESVVFNLNRIKTEYVNQGSLPLFVAASCAVPVMFHPVRIGNCYYLDGGVFQKSAIDPNSSEVRTLSIFLQGEGWSDAYEWNRSLHRRSKNHIFLRMRGLTRLGPNEMHKGSLAYKEAYIRVRDTLKKKLTIPNTGLIDC